MTTQPDLRTALITIRDEEFNGEPWLRRAQNIDLIHDPSETARQAPHSSSGDGQ